MAQRNSFETKAFLSGMPCAIFFVLLVLLVISQQAWGVSVPLSGTRNVFSGQDCDLASYRFGTNTTYEGQPLDLLVEVLSEDNEHAPGGGRPNCVGVGNQVLEVYINDQDAEDNAAHVDMRLTLVRAGTSSPVEVDRLIVTGFDLDSSSGTATDDLYFNTGPATQSYVSENSQTSVLSGSYFGGSYNTRIQGRTSGNCTDDSNSVDPECRASVVFVGTSTANIRIQNDNAYGTNSSFNSYRGYFISFRVDDFEDLIESNTDYGDTPAAYASSRQSISSQLGLGRGLVADSDAAQQQSANADGDDNDGTGGAVVNFDDEDGVSVSGQSLNGRVFTPGENVDVDFSTFGSGYLNAWFDWNRDNDFSDPGERVVTDLYIENNGETNSGVGSSNFITETAVPISVPASLSDGNSFARFKFTRSPNPGIGNSPDDGEVEDYGITLSSLFCDLPVSTSMQLGGDATRDAGTGEITLTPEAGNRRGYAWSENQISLLSDFSLEFDVYLGAIDANGADGIAFAFQDDPAGNGAIGEFGGALGVGGLSPAVAVEFDTWNNGAGYNDIADDHTMIYDPQNYGEFSSGGQQYTPTVSLGNIEDAQWHSVQLEWDAASHTLSYSFDGNLVGSTDIDFVESVFAGNPNVYFGFAAATGGSFNEQKVCITASPPQVLTDYGDAPSSFGEPSHILGAGLVLGAAVDEETSGFNDPDALADNFDDGVSLPGDFPNDSPVEVEVSGADGYLQAWIDWNQDGVFSEEERIATDLQDDDGDGLIQITANTPPAGALPGDSYARFRWSSQSGLNAEDGAQDGEVEDYRVTIGPVPFQCTNSLYQVATPISQLRRIDFAGSSASFVDVGPGAGQGLNAGWGYNDQDGFIHGLRSGTTELWFIDASGIFYSNGSPAGLPNGRNGSNAGDVLPDGRMIYKTSNNRLSVIDLTSSPPSYQGDINLSVSLNFIDMAFNPVDGRVYAIDQNVNRLAWINLATGQVTRFGPPIPGGSYGAQWFDEDGRFYAYENNSDSLYFFDVGVDGSGSGSRVLLANSTNSVGGINDGAFCRGEAPVPLGGVSGKVYQDVDGSDTFDNGEPGLADIEVRLYRDGGTPGNFADDVLVGSVDTDTNGDYLFPSVLGAQTYRVEVNVNDTDLPAGAALGTASPLTGILVLDESIASNNNFGFDILNIILSGWVFEDNGVGATAHDGVKGESEPGFANQTVTLFHDTDGNGECADGDPVLASDQTSGDGAFTLTVSPVDAGKDVCLVAQTPSGFLSVSESGGSLPATTGTANDDRQTFTLPAPGIAVTGLLFGDAGLPVLEPDQQGVVAAGGSRFYAHRFSARSAGIVDFVLGAAATSPANPAWSDTLYRDDNCDGALNGADETLPVTGISVTAGEQHCLLVKTFAPANAPVGALHQRPLSALQLYTGTSFQASAKVVDSTRIAAGELELEKRVQNLTAGTAGGTSNQAEPGDVLRYRLIFRNQGTSALTEVVINDSTPAFTVLNAALLCPALPLPTGLTGCAVDTPDGANVAGYKGGLEWTFTGELQPGAEGEVRYEVQVDQ